MNCARLAAVILLALVAVGPVRGSGTVPTSLLPPVGLKPFLLRTDEPAVDTFPRTPSFAWWPYAGASSYGFELATSKTFDESSVVWSTSSLTFKLKTPAVSIPLALPWMTGKQPYYALYARVRARFHGGWTPWSRPYGFNMRWKSLPQESAADYPGLVRWDPVEGATSYQVWFIEEAKRFSTVTNVADEREYYTFHQSTQRSGVVSWRVRAVRKVYGALPNGLPAVTYGPWSDIFTSVNPAFATGPLTPTAAVSETVTTPSASVTHNLTPGFVFSGNQSFDGNPYELYRVYVATDRDCVNVVFKGSIVGSPAYAPRITQPLALPGGSIEVAAARTRTFSPDLPLDSSAHQVGEMADFTPVTPSDELGSAPSGSSSSTPTDSTIPPDLLNPASPSALDDLWDSGWPSGQYYWTVVPVQAGVDSRGVWSYQDVELPQDACQEGRVLAFGKTSAPATTSASGKPFVSGLSPAGRLASAAGASPSFYGVPIVAWEPALGATAYEVQRSKRLYPFSVVGNSIFTAATSTLLAGLSPGTWYYRVRGIDPYVPGAVKTMTWSDPVAIVITKPKIAVAPAG
jgi:hypothetical protein